MWVLLMISALWLRAETSYYRLESSGTARASVVTEFRWSRDRPNAEDALLYLEARKASGARFRVWSRNGSRGRTAPLRYILQEGDQRPREYRDALGGALTPKVFALQLTPKITGEGAEYLGHRYTLQSKSGDPPPPMPEDAAVVTQRPDLLIGTPHNTRPVDDRRRWDDSDYELRRLTREEFREMADAGITCVNVDAEQAAWAEELGLFYWGAAAQLPYPEMLYRSLYLGGTLFLDEPAVGTRDHVIRPRLAKDPDFRKSLQPETVLEAFRKYFQETAHRVAHATHKILAARQDVDLGGMQLVQTNLYTWETMPASAIHQLTQDPYSPAAFVFEPPGRIGTQRTVPEMNMTYGTQLAQDDPPLRPARRRKQCPPRSLLDLHFPICPHANHLPVVLVSHTRQVPEQIKGNAHTLAALDLQKEVTHHGAVFHALFVDALKVQFRQPPQQTLPHKYVAEIVARRQENRRLAGIA
ncbi:MAG: hypothetical protein JNL98_06205 [Bryobacterales bacterium]|nr:hypothetical protein [Bryobacterales bacterium]